MCGIVGFTRGPRLARRRRWAIAISSSPSAGIRFRASATIEGLTHDIGA